MIGMTAKCECRGVKCDWDGSQMQVEWESNASAAGIKREWSGGSNANGVGVQCEWSGASNASAAGIKREWSGESNASAVKEMRMKSRMQWRSNANGAGLNSE